MEFKSVNLFWYVPFNALHQENWIKLPQPRKLNKIEENKSALIRTTFNKNKITSASINKIISPVCRNVFDNFFWIYFNLSVSKYVINTVFVHAYSLININ